MGTISYLFLFIGSLVFLCYYFSHDAVHCRVDHATGVGEGGDKDAANGYYVALREI